MMTSFCGVLSPVKNTNSSSLSSGSPLFRPPVLGPVPPIVTNSDWPPECAWYGPPSPSIRFRLPLKKENCRDRRARRGGKQMTITPTLISIIDQKPELMSSMRRSATPRYVNDWKLRRLHVVSGFLADFRAKKRIILVKVMLLPQVNIRM